MLNENDIFFKTIYAIMISLGISHLEINKELAIKSNDPPMYMTYDVKQKKYVFDCVDVDKESKKNFPIQDLEFFREAAKENNQETDILLYSLYSNLYQEYKELQEKIKNKEGM